MSSEKNVKIYNLSGKIDRTKRTAVVGSEVDSKNILPENATRRRKDYIYSEPTKFKPQMIERDVKRSSANVYEKRGKNKENVVESNAAVDDVTSDMSKMKIRKRKVAAEKPASEEAPKPQNPLSDAVVAQVTRLGGKIKPVTASRPYNNRSASMPISINTFVDIEWSNPNFKSSKFPGESFEMGEFCLEAEEMNFDFAVKNKKDFVFLGECPSYILSALESASNPDFIVHVVNPDENKTVSTMKISEFLASCELSTEPSSQ